MSLTELGPVNTTGVDGVADENRARTGPPRTALGPWGGEPGPHGQLLVRGVENRAPTDSSWSVGWRTGPPRTALGPWGGDEAEDEGLG